MTDHFFGGEGGEKEAGDQFLIRRELQPASFSPPSHYQQLTVIANAAKQSFDIQSNIKICHWRGGTTIQSIDN
jgi:hypothetical protein